MEYSDSDVPDLGSLGPARAPNPDSTLNMFKDVCIYEQSLRGAALAHRFKLSTFLYFRGERSVLHTRYVGRYSWT